MYQILQVDEHPVIISEGNTVQLKIDTNPDKLTSRFHNVSDRIKHWTAKIIGCNWMSKNVFTQILFFSSYKNKYWKSYNNHLNGNTIHCIQT